MSANSDKKFRFVGVNFFLTYPQNSTDKEVVLKNIQTVFGDRLKFAIVAQEDHKDEEGLHLHCAISCHKRIDWRSKKKIDGLAGGKTGNYQTAKSLIAVVRYVVKDGNYVSYGVNVEEFLKQAKMKKSTSIALTLKEFGLDAAVNQDIGFGMMNLRKLQEFQAYQESLKRKKVKVSLTSLTAKQSTGQEQGGNNGLIAGWLNDNLFSDKVRKVRTPQLYIHGDPGLGKTRLIGRLLEKGVRVYMWPDEDFHDLYGDDEYDVIVLDEFKGQVKLTNINKWLDGQQQAVRRKGVAPYIKNKNLPFIILSNFSARDAYRNSSDQSINPFLDRIIQVRVNEMIDVEIEKLDDPTSDDDDEVELIVNNNNNNQPPLLISDAEFAQTMGINDSLSDDLDDTIIQNDADTTYDPQINTTGIPPKRMRDIDSDNFDSEGTYIGNAQLTDSQFECYKRQCTNDFYFNHYSDVDNSLSNSEDLIQCYEDYENTYSNLINDFSD